MQNPVDGMIDDPPSLQQRSSSSSETLVQEVAAHINFLAQHRV